jgi:hypothetical protein
LKSNDAPQKIHRKPNEQFSFFGTIAISLQQASELTQGFLGEVFRHYRRRTATDCEVNAGFSLEKFVGIFRRRTAAEYVMNTGVILSRVCRHYRPYHCSGIRGEYGVIFSGVCRHFRP